MPTPVSDNPSVPHSADSPTISAQGHLVTGSGFLPDHRVAIRITRAGVDISDYLTYVTDGHGDLHCELHNGATGTSYIAATDPTAPMVRVRAAGCGATPIPSSWLTPNRPTTIARQRCCLGKRCSSHHALLVRSADRTRRLAPRRCGHSNGRAYWG
jgi:hypothetical protein